MAKSQKAEQLVLFAVNPEIKNLGTTSVDLKGNGMITGQFAAVTEATDLAQLTPERWAQAAACWMVRLCDNDPDRIRDYVQKAKAMYEQDLNAITEFNDAQAKYQERMTN